MVVYMVLLVVNSYIIYATLNVFRSSIKYNYFCQPFSMLRLFKTLSSRVIITPTLRILCEVIEIQPL